MPSSLRHEVIGPHFEKWHVDACPAWPFGMAFHRFTAPDEGDPHDHPFGFTSHVLRGGFEEEVFVREGDGVRLVERISRMDGDVYTVTPDRIHRINRLYAPEAWTLIVGGPVVQEWRHWPIV